MSYPYVLLGDYIDILSGFAFKSKDFSENGIPVIKIKNIVPPYVTLEDLSYVPNEIAKSNQKYLLTYNDVLIALTGSHINQMASVVGRIARVKYNIPSLLNQRVGKITVKNEGSCDINYVYYFLSQEHIKIVLASKAGGAANQANISLSDIKKLIIPLPPIEIQRRIADILSAYDNLIENNQKQIKLLEEAAQRLYKEWFVDLHFPDHEHTKIVDGVPEGWRIRVVSDFGEVITGKTPSTSKPEYYDGNIPFVTIPDMHNTIFPLSTEKHLSEQGANTQKNKFLPPNSVMVSCIATVGLVNIASEWCQTNQQINSVILEDNKDLYFFYFAMKRIKSLLDGVGSNGATMTNVNKTKFESIKILYPGKYLTNCFFEFSMPIFQKILVLSKVNQSLQQARDRLLPKLMSGEVEV